MKNSERERKEKVMKNKMIGVIGVEAFTSRVGIADKPIIFERHIGSDVRRIPGNVLKNTMKNMWRMQCKKVFDVQQYYFLKTIEEQYKSVFGVENLKDKTDKEKVELLMNAVDIRNFGIIYPDGNINFGIRRTVDVFDGYSLYDNTVIKTESKGEAQLCVTVDESYYFFPFIILPKNRKELLKLGILDEYTEEDYNDFKQAAMSSVSFYGKTGEYNNKFAMFVEVNNDSGELEKEILDYIEVSAENGKKVIDLSKLSEKWGHMEKWISKIEIYYDPNGPMSRFSTS